VSPIEVKAKIEGTEARGAQVDANRIKLEANGNEVILQGSVRSRAEREEAERREPPHHRLLRNFACLRSGAVLSTPAPPPAGALTAHVASRAAVGDRSAINGSTLGSFEKSSSHFVINAAATPLNKCA
jgi:hypothetical protein